MSKSIKMYADIEAEISSMMVTTWFTNLATVSAVLTERLPNLNWVGFYLLNRSDLILGPFQGRAACLKIAVGKGVCGTAAATRQTICVDDVHAFPGHIACDERSKSEIVVPLILGERCLGVLDLDAPMPARFNEDDQRGLEKIAATLIRATTWPSSFSV